MEDEDGAEGAISKLNGTEIDGQEVKVEKAKPRYLLSVLKTLRITILKSLWCYHTYNICDFREEGRGGGRSFGSRGFGDRGRSGGFGGGRSGGFGDRRRDDRRDDRRGGGGGACYNCNQSGHIARDCPDGDRRGGGGGFGRRGGGGGNRSCYNCNQEGHMARECPEGDRRDRGGR